jgi:hypothetical protein
MIAEKLTLKTNKKFMGFADEKGKWTACSEPVYNFLEKHVPCSFEIEAQDENGVVTRVKNVQEDKPMEYNKQSESLKSAREESEEIRALRIARQSSLERAEKTIKTILETYEDERKIKRTVEEFVQWQIQIAEKYVNFVMG